MIAKTENLMAKAASCINFEHPTTRRRKVYGEIKYESLELPNLKKDPHPKNTSCCLHSANSSQL